MTESDATPPVPDVPPAAETPPEPPPAVERPRHGLWWLFALVLLALVGSQAAQWYLMLNPLPLPDPLAPRVAALEVRLTRLEQRPAPAVPDLAPLEARVAALERAPHPPQVPAAPSDAEQAMAQRLSADEARLATLEKTAALPAQTAERTSRIGRLQAAFLALSLGRPLGPIDGAPPALARYANAAPPTEASLRRDFATAAQAALAVQHTPAASQPFLDRLWARAQELITIQQDGRLVVGDPDAVVLARARGLLADGDLAGAVAALDALRGPAAQAMADWCAQAKGLLAARAALADLAAQP